jgi:outer membrane receptor protein involved in Fe transport
LCSKTPEKNGAFKSFEDLRNADPWASISKSRKGEQTDGCKDPGWSDRVYTIATPTGDVGETPTAGYNLLKLSTSYSFVSGKTTSTITARLDNATDTLYRNHLNFLKDLAPEMGRNVRVVYSVKF